MQVIRHHHVTQQGHCESVAQQQNPLFYPSLAMVIVLISVGIDAPQKTAPHTARDDVKGAGLARWHEVRSGGGHAAMLRPRNGDCYQISLSFESRTERRRHVDAANLQKSKALEAWGTQSSLAIQA